MTPIGFVVKADVRSFRFHWSELRQRYQKRYDRRFRSGKPVDHSRPWVKYAKPPSSK